MKKKKTKKPKQETKVFYLCGVDWQHELELGECADVRFFKSRDLLMKDRPCVAQCGIVKITMKGEWIYPQNFDSPIKGLKP